MFFYSHFEYAIDVLDLPAPYPNNLTVLYIPCIFCKKPNGLTVLSVIFQHFYVLSISAYKIFSAYYFHLVMLVPLLHLRY